MDHPANRPTTSPRFTPTQQALYDEAQRRAARLDIAPLDALADLDATDWDRVAVDRVLIRAERAEQTRPAA